MHPRRDGPVGFEILKSPVCGLIDTVEESNANDVKGFYCTNVFGLLNVTRAVLAAGVKYAKHALSRERALGGAKGIYQQECGATNAGRQVSVCHCAAACILRLDQLGYSTS